MKYHKVKGLEKNISQLVLGTDYYSPSIYKRIKPILDQFVALGGNVIDTAFIYAGGESEKAIGMWMKESNNRDQVVILTKGAHHDHTGPRVNPEAIASDLEISLERLQTDYIDMYALHRDDPNVPVEVIIDALNDHIASGKIHTIGASNWTHQRIEEANNYAAKNGLTGFSFNSPNLSLAKANEPFWAGCVSADEDTLAWHEQQQFPLLSWSSQARGFFTGRFTPENRENEDLVRVFYSDANWERLRRAEQLAKERNVSTIQIALAYVLNQSFPSCALIGPQNNEELQSCVDATNILLSKEEITWLDLSSEK